MRITKTNNNNKKKCCYYLAPAHSQNLTPGQAAGCAVLEISEVRFC